MFNEQAAQPNPYLQAVKDHLSAGARVFVVILLLCGAGAFLTRQYSASSVLALNPQALAGANGQQRDPVEAAWSALSDQQIAGLISRFQLDRGIARVRAQGQIFTYVRSNISMNAAGNVTGAPASGSREIVVTYTGESPAETIGMANAIAQEMSQAKIPAQRPPAPAAGLPAAPTLADSELEKSRARLKALSQSPVPDMAALQAQVQQHLKTDAALQSDRDDAAAKLDALEEESTRLMAEDRAATAPPPAPAPDPARIALEEQIRAAQNHLANLRQRYTELYPDVQQAETTLATLQARLSHMPAEKPRTQAQKAAPHAAERNALILQADQLRAQLSNLDNEIDSNQEEAEALRQRIAGAKARAQEYAAEQQRYNTLLQVQEALDEGGNAAGAGQAPLFMVVESASSAEPLGLAFKPVFWISSFGFALLAAAISIYLAEQFAPAVHESAPSRSFHPS